MRLAHLLPLFVAIVAGCERAGIAPSDRALLDVTDAVESGRLPASSLLHDARFAAVKEDPATRPAIRELVRVHATDSDVRMIRDDEPGERMTLRIRIEDERTGEPQAGVIVSVVEVDATGYYFEDDDAWNPRLFGSALTDDGGTVTFRTIRPPHYGAKYEAEEEPAHVHFDIVTDGYRPFHWEIWFEDDPRITDAMRGDSAPPTATVRRDADGTWLAEVTIPLQPSD